MPLTADTIKALQQYFDKVLVVSVPRFAARHEKVKRELAGLSFDFFWGADKQQLDPDTIKRDGTYDETTAKKLQRQGKPLNLGEIACSLSHRMLYEEMLKQQWKRVLVLEDDIVALEQNLPALSQTLAELPADWELVYFGYLKHEQVTTGLRIKQFFYKLISALGGMKWTYTMVRNMLPRPFSKHLKRAGFHDCTHAYAVSLEGAARLAKAQTPVVYRADDLLSHTILKGELKAFVTEPKFFDQEIFHNTAIASEIRLPGKN
ncbi:MAG TPA: glycosyltransferase family 25 protein [Ferruginibacter sp.]|nr:glycosyltransferase family 25 protein [Ferruginibacter sp.]MBN8698555.1 glycosyltransferase family 25 protein [Chitinophagales bacterium]HNA01198.1 glycosyltransferase family 25 protein [Ferruginibacter sp.]HNJ28648.1 glycosyltransferase family 25 protein [Ferruginibacter sp.]HQQ99429.1 glycosyltransferase family 25 protein [Ferruginibacter sp.]